MDKTQFGQFLRSVHPISAEDAATIMECFVPAFYEKGELILGQGSVSDTYLYLQRGLVRTYLVDLQGDEVTTDFYVENSIVFEVTSFFNRTPSQVNIEALTACEGFRVNFEQLNTLFHAKPAFREIGRGILVRSFIASKNRNYAMITQTAEQRYQQLLQEKPQIIQQAPLKQIASYLGMTDSTLSRIRAKI